MGFVTSKNMWLAVLAAATALALSIVFGVTLAQGNHQMPREISSESNTSNTGGANPSPPFRQSELDEIIVGANLKSDAPLDPKSVTTLEIDLSARVLTCPSGPGSSQTFSAADLTHPAAVRIRMSRPKALCTLVRIDNPNGDGVRENTFLHPIARSYSGHDWEPSRGKFVQETSFTCQARYCTINLNKLEAKEGGGVYQLTSSWAPRQYRKQSVVARFLEQATFGANLQEIRDLENLEPGWRDALKKSRTLGQWVQNQQDETMFPIMSHRAIFREKVNARSEHPGPIGRVSLPCEKGARFRRFAFSEKDAGKDLELVRRGNFKLFKVDGKVRTASSNSLYFINQSGNIANLNYPNGRYRICSVEFDKHTGVSTVTLKHPNHSKCISLVVRASDGTHYSNPPVETHADGNYVMLALQAGSAQQIDAEYSAASRQGPLTANMVTSPSVPEIILTSDLTDAACAALSTKEGAGDKTVIAEWNGMNYLFDPRYHLLNNDLQTPLVDGGGRVANEFGSHLGEEYSVMCSNAPRTFVNEESCYLSDETNACSYLPPAPEASSRSDDRDGNSNSEFVITLEMIQDVYQATGAGEPGTVYLYALDGLDVTKDTTVVPPCQSGARARWVIEPCSTTPGQGLAAQTVAFFEMRLKLAQGRNTNPYFLDWRRNPNWNDACDPADDLKKGFVIRNTLEDGTCFRHVHPSHLNVFDFTEWAEVHPGNSEARNPITEFAEAGESKLVFPHWHEVDRWHQQRARIRPWNLKLGVAYDFYSLPQQLRTDEVAAGLGLELSNQVTPGGRTGVPVIVCGSPYEVANDPFKGGGAERGAFDVITMSYRTSAFRSLEAQRWYTWLIAAMNDPGQLRQKAAWALSQIFAIDPSAIQDNRDKTEHFVTYYDIFVRNAFKNYRDVMKEVSYSPVMAEMLTYYGGRSTATVLEDEGNVEYADENYAREIMQLFTTGLYELNPDATQALDDQGATKRVYNNDDIEEYARAWTGFIRQGRRGNLEERMRWNQIDPMKIEAEWRDSFPKMGLERKYVGDGYPLCSDLPPRHFLSKGATYRLLESNAPELQVDPIEWRVEFDVVRLSLEDSSNLKTKLLEEAPATKIVLDTNLDCQGIECNIDTIRTVDVGDYTYEYIRSPCVHLAYYNDAKTVERRANGGRPMCADPRVESATAACCGATPSWSEEFFGERMTFSTAVDRCSTSLCGINTRPACHGSQCLDNNYYWTADPCTLKAKVDMSSGKVAIVHGPNGVAEDDISSSVRSHTKTFFRVDWEGDFAQALAICEGQDGCSLTDDGMCLCEVSVSEEQVFSGATAPTRADILSSLHIGAPEPAGAVSESITRDDDVKVYNVGVDNKLTPDSVFEVLDDAGQRALRRNIRSTVSVADTGLSFRNPVHFLNLADPEPRDAHQETDATLDHYFYHRNTAPFVAYRFAQRFGISNPSPRYTQVIANAFKTGTYAFELNKETLYYGKGQYGDLAATFAAVLLDREARDFVLDSDPAHGSIREPLVKIVGMMRALEFDLNDIYKWTEFYNNIGEKIGQMAHQIPSVFSFFLPEYESAGPVSQGGLVSPEAQVLTGPRIIDTMNGILSMLKYGLNGCEAGFGPWETDMKCGRIQIGEHRVVGGMSYTETSSAVAVDELANLLTAGRLNPETRSIVQDVYSGNEDGNAAIRAQMLISATPEFHGTGLSQPSGENRPAEPAPARSDKPYKALVYVMLDGGYDSYNTLVPHTCTATNGAGKTLLQQYEFERTVIKLKEEERTRVIDATGQACDQFAVHPEMEILERLYNEGDLSFFANVGQLDAPVTKDNYFENTRSQLFAHNTMTEEAQRVDPWDTAPGTGILGRMCDALKVKGYTPQPITVQDVTVATVGVPGASVPPLVASFGGSTRFAPARRTDRIDLNDYVSNLNNSTKLHSSVFGETWSAKLHSAIEDAEMLTDAIGKVELTQNYPNDEDGQKFISTAETLANLILTHEERGADRDVLFTRLGGWDHHANVKEGLETNFKGFNKGLSLFESEMKAQGLWDQVTVMVVSDFGRTLTANSQMGCDHAWAGHYFMFGGSVNGGQIHGEYPPDISTDGPLNIGRGRLIPTSSWESMFTGPLEWMGLDTEADLDYCMPNRLNTGAAAFTQDQVFEQGRRSLRGKEQ